MVGTFGVSGISVTEAGTLSEGSMTFTEFPGVGTRLIHLK